jgi:hypothetical protein
VFEGLPVTYNELFVDGLAKPDEAVAKLAYQPAQKSFKVAIECPVVGQPLQMRTVSRLSADHVHGLFDIISFVHGEGDDVCCCAAVMLLYSQYGPAVQGYMSDLVKTMIAALSLPGERPNGVLL